MRQHRMASALGLLSACIIACGDDATGSDPADAGTNADSGITSQTDAGMTPEDSGVATPDAGFADTGEKGPTVSEVDPACVDGQWREVLPDPTIEIEPEIMEYYNVSSTDFITSILDKRYPTGSYLVRNGLMWPQQNCVDEFADRSSPQNMIHSINTVVHECGHAFGFLNQGPTVGTWTYTFNESVQLACSEGGPESEGGKTFARSELDNDSYASLRPPCSGSSNASCDYFHQFYFGSSAGQGFDLTLEEAVQYVNSLATAYSIHDWYGANLNHMDAVLTFLWYIERYLKVARESHPTAYQLLSRDQCWRRAILTLWGRAWLYLELSDGIRELGLYQNNIVSLVRDPNLMNEIELLRQAEGCN